MRRINRTLCLLLACIFAFGVPVLAEETASEAAPAQQAAQEEKAAAPAQQAAQEEKAAAPAQQTAQEEKAAEAVPAQQAESEVKATESAEVQTPSEEGNESQPSESEAISPEETGSPEETAAPEETASPEETGSPEETPSPEETVSPEETASPEETPSPEETILPEETLPPEEEIPLPGTISGDVSIRLTVSSEVRDGVLTVPCASESSGIGFQWTLEGGHSAKVYYLYLDNAAGSRAYLGRTGDHACTIAAQDCMGGANTLYVGARIEDDSVVWGKLSFTVEIQSEAEKPEEDASMPGAGDFGGFSRPSGGGGGSSGGSSAGNSGEQNTGVVAGTALLSSHNSGSRDMTGYAALELEAQTGITALELAHTGARIQVESGDAFDARLEEGALALTAAPEAVFVFDAQFLATLHRGGIETLQLESGTACWRIATDFAFAGSDYAKYRMEGVPSAAFVLSVSSRGWFVTVNDVRYALSQNGEMTAAQE